MEIAQVRERIKALAHSIRPESAQHKQAKQMLFLVEGALCDPETTEALIQQLAGFARRTYDAEQQPVQKFA